MTDGSMTLVQIFTLWPPFYSNVLLSVPTKTAQQYGGRVIDLDSYFPDHEQICVFQGYVNVTPQIHANTFEIW